MLASMSSTMGICALPFTGTNLVTMTPWLLALTKVASMCLSGIWGLGVGIYPFSGLMSCPVALGLCQVVGWVPGLWAGFHGRRPEMQGILAKGSRYDAME